jgi:glutamate dehydrogenase
MKALLELEGDSASGEEVVRRILMARVDLLYNGGIGTYVKASSEEDEEVGDRANDRVRVDGRELRARVVAEGGNLGFTQRGRLEYWAGGGLVNTDAVDNSGGVDMSDHEVNIKILLDLLVKKAVVKGREERNRVLAEMTEEVAELVLADNENQARALSLDGRRSRQRYEAFVAYVEDLLGAGVMNRQDDAVPAREELLSSPHRDRGLPRPLLAVMLGHTKRWAFDLLMETEFPESAAGRPFLVGYFPRRLRERLAEFFDEHTLRREIVATAAVNHVVNNAGIMFLTRTMAEGKAGPGEVLSAYLAVEAESGAAGMRERLFAAGLAAAEEQEALLELEGRLQALTLEVLAGRKPPLAEALAPIAGRIASA